MENLCGAGKLNKNTPAGTSVDEVRSNGGMSPPRARSLCLLLADARSHMRLSRQNGKETSGRAAECDPLIIQTGPKEEK